MYNFQDFLKEFMSKYQKIFSCGHHKKKTGQAMTLTGAKNAA
jgi:hypothetical protein